MANFIKAPSSRQGTIQSVACTSSSTTVTNAFGAQTYQIQLSANTACHYKIVDVSGSAATTDTFLPANVIDVKSITPGQKISAIRASSAGLVTATDGTLWVTELT